MSDKDYKEKYKEYKEKYYQEINKKDDERKSKNDVYNPIVNVNVNCCENKKESVRPSAFRAVNKTAGQRLLGPTDLPVDPIPIEYPDEIFDLNKEYDRRTSIFTPKQDGVYLIIGSIGLLPDGPANYSARIFIVVNGNSVAADNDFFGEELPITNLVSVSTIVKLFTGDEVQVFAQSITDGTVVPDPIFTHYEAARIPL